MKTAASFVIPLWVSLTSLPYFAIAGEALLARDEMSSRFGILKVLDDQDEKRLYIGKKPLPISDHLVRIEQKWQMGARDVFFVFMDSGANGCPVTYAFASVESKVVSLSDAFGNCNDSPNVERLGIHIIVSFGRLSRDRPALLLEFDDGAVFEGRKNLKVTSVA